MEENAKTFQWENEDHSLIFPIDYTLNEGTASFGQNKSLFRKNVLKHPLIKDALLELSVSSSKDSSKNVCPPSPIEAMPFLNCFNQLIKRKDRDYHKKFACNLSKFSKDTVPPAILKHFWSDLCHSLYEKTAPQQNDKDKDLNAYYRHILFQNEQFTATLFSDLWNQEVSPRYKTIKRLIKQVDAQSQLIALRECLFTLDRIILNLQSAHNNKKSKKSPKLTVDSITRLLKDLLSTRRSHKVSNKKRDYYCLPNILLENGDTLENAFSKINRQGKPTKESPLLLSEARQAYLSNLVKEAEKNRKSSELEKQYTFIEQYLENPSSFKAEVTLKIVQERCKGYFQRVIDFTTCSAMQTLETTLDFTMHPYKDDFIGHLIPGIISKSVRIFRETIQIVTYHNMAWIAAMGFWDREIVNLYYLKERIRGGLKSANDIEFLLSELDKIPTRVYPASLTSISFFKNINNFCAFFQEAWKFIYGNSTSPFVEGARTFKDSEITASLLWTSGQSAAQFFSRDMPFNSQEELRDSLDFIEYIALNFNAFVPPLQYWGNAAKSLQLLFLIISQKIIESESPKIAELVKKYLAFSQKSIT